ncbi:MAG: M1 family aminopeptidase [Bryobacterales bacterium]
MLRVILALFVVCFPALLTAGEAQDRLDELLAVRLDPTRCWRIRDLFLEREDFKFYLNDGYLILSEPYHGRDVAALFLAESSLDSGELVLIPPNMGERQSLARFTGETVLNERFTSALMLFTDDTAKKLIAQIDAGASAKPDLEKGQALQERWSPVLKNILEGVAARLMHDTLSQVPLEDGFFASAIGGGRHGRFDAVVDPQLHEQVLVGQSAWRAERRFYEIWCQFPSRSVRSGNRARLQGVGALENYNLDVNLLPDLSMQVKAEADFVPGRSGYRTLGVEIAGRLHVSNVTLNGQAADFLQMDTASATAAARRENSLVFILAPEALPEGKPVRLSVDYEGTVISRAGQDVYYVGSRANWYPRAEPGFTEIAMTFRHPASLDLVATGKLVETSVEGDVRTSRFESAAPIRTAGFNLGHYAKAIRETDGYTIEVMANQVIEERLKPKASALILPDLTGPRRRGPIPAPQQVVVPAVVPRAPNPAARIEELADSDTEAFRFFLDRFGPPPTKQVIVSPIPAGFGQGFPGLVYAATLSYLSASDSPLDKMPAGDRQFYLELLRPHEIAHQWWGNNISIESGSDLWMMEALATYSSLLYLEHKRGPDEMRATLQGFREHLLEKNQDGDVIESAGPVSLGERLMMAKFPTAYRLILYEKGAWIFHMLRGVLGDTEFFELLSQLSGTYRLKELTVDQLRQAAAAHLPKDYPDRELHDFFEQWVYGTGVPRLSTTFKTSATGSKTIVEGLLRQDGVPENFVTPVVLRLESEGAKPIEKTVWTEGPETPFRFETSGKNPRVRIDPNEKLLAIR